jgi:hypothetical protein
MPFNLRSLFIGKGVLVGLVASRLTEVCLDPWTSNIEALQFQCGVDFFQLSQRICNQFFVTNFVEPI